MVRPVNVAFFCVTSFIRTTIKIVIIRFLTLFIWPSFSLVHCAKFFSVAGIHSWEEVKFLRNKTSIQIPTVFPRCLGSTEQLGLILILFSFWEKSLCLSINYGHKERMLYDQQNYFDITFDLWRWKHIVPSLEMTHCGGFQWLGFVWWWDQATRPVIQPYCMSSQNSQVALEIVLSLLWRDHQQILYH